MLSSYFHVFALHIQSKLFLIIQKLNAVKTENFVFCWFEFQSLIQTDVSESIDDREVCRELILNITPLLFNSSYYFDHIKNIREMIQFSCESQNLVFLISFYHHYFSECDEFEEDPLEEPVDFLIQSLHNPDWFFVQKAMEIIPFLKIGDNFVDSSFDFR